VIVREVRRRMNIIEHGWKDTMYFSGGGGVVTVTNG
jgi:hypothetical protein